VSLRSQAAIRAAISLSGPSIGAGGSFAAAVSSYLPFRSYLSTAVVMAVTAAGLADI
jgi:uncharacterized membrane protein